MSKKSPRRSSRSQRSRNPVASFLRKPLVQISIVILAALAIFLIVSGSGRSANSPAEVSVDQAYQMYQQGVFLLDVRTPEEWDQFHVPGTTLIPLDELPNRVNEVPHDQQIVVVCRSGNRSQAGRDILLQAGFKNVSSMSGGLTSWQSKGYPTVSGP